MKNRSFIALLFAGVSLTFSQAPTTNPVQLIRYEQSTCDQSSDPTRLIQRIVSKSIFKDTLFLEIGFATTCCIEYVPIVSTQTDSLFISIVDSQKHPACFCYCCFQMQLAIQGIKDPDIPVLFFDSLIVLSDEKYKTYPPIHHIFKGDTVNRKGKYGLKQGYWVQIKKDKHREFTIYKDNRMMAWGTLYHNGHMRKKYDAIKYMHSTYYRSGQKKSECPEKSPLNCMYWNKRGKQR